MVQGDSSGRSGRSGLRDGSSILSEDKNVAGGVDRLLCFRMANHFLCKGIGSPSE